MTRLLALALLVACCALPACKPCSIDPPPLRCNAPEVGSCQACTSRFCGWIPEPTPADPNAGSCVPLSVRGVRTVQADMICRTRDCPTNVPVPPEGTP